MRPHVFAFLVAAVFMLSSTPARAASCAGPVHCICLNAFGTTIGDVLAVLDTDVIRYEIVQDENLGPVGVATVRIREVFGDPSVPYAVDEDLPSTEFSGNPFNVFLEGDSVGHRVLLYYYDLGATTRRLTVAATIEDDRALCEQTGASVAVSDAIAAAFSDTCSEDLRVLGLEQPPPPECVASGCTATSEATGQVPIVLALVLGAWRRRRRKRTTHMGL